MNRLGSWGLLIFLAITGLVLWWHDGGKAQVGPPNQIQCNHLAQASPATATASSVFTNETGATVVGNASNRIDICGWHVTATSTTAATFQFVAGVSSGTTPGCTGTQAILTPAFTVTNTAPATDHVDYASLSLALGQQLCVTTTGTTGLQIGVWYSQQ